MAFRKPFIVSDESVNSYGFWVRTMGIRLEQAKLNCPCFYNHDTRGIPLGHWENFRVDENGKLLADLVIEGANEEERNFIRKIENGDIRGASVGLDVISMSDDPLQLKPGQTRSTIMDSELFEISITPLPGNTNALALRYNGKLVTLSDGFENNIVPLINIPDMKSIAVKLGLPESATEVMIIESITRLQQNLVVTESMRSHIEAQANEQLETDGQKSFFVSLCKTDFPAALQFLQLNKKEEATEAKIKKDVTLSDLIKKGKTEQAHEDEGKNTFDYLQKHDPVKLSNIKSTEPEKYQRLVADYGKGVRYTGK